MWHANIDTVDADTRRVSLSWHDRPISRFEAIKAWQQDSAFRDFFIAQLCDAPYRAYFWETPPITRANAGSPFEFVLIDSPMLARVAAEPEDYEEHFQRMDEWSVVVDFANLSGDAWLVAPTPRAPVSAYPHLAAFSRKAPQAQQHAFWERVGAAIERRLGDQPMWVSTAGTGVYWLHVRLDTRPKYYSYQPYRDRE